MLLLLAATIATTPLELEEARPFLVAFGLLFVFSLVAGIFDVRDERFLARQRPGDAADFAEGCAQLARHGCIEAVLLVIVLALIAAFVAFG
jgi:hypothetical protein